MIHKNGMKARHAAALALIGWYLMMSPSTGTKDTPLSQWEIHGSYDTAAECRQAFEAKLVELAKVTTPPPNATSQTWRQWINQNVLGGTDCISTDGPRLKPN